jgi:hypothetical protein
MNFFVVVVCLEGSDLRLWNQMEWFAGSVRSEYLWQLFLWSPVRMGVGQRF